VRSRQRFQLPLLGIAQRHCHRRLPHRQAPAIIDKIVGTSRSGH
jgi:hypothetical protein